jgi:hypothetical protein
MKKLCSAVAITLLAMVPGFAQEKPANTIASLEFQTPKNGMVKQYEDGRKQKAAWHKAQKDALPLMVFESVAGDHSGTYVVGRFGQHWADFDKPSVSDEADRDEFNKVIGSAVESRIRRYYELLVKDSKPPDSKNPSKYSEILTYRVRPGKGQEFHAAITRANEAIEKTKWPVHYFWYTLASGGTGEVYVLVIPHENWADFEDKPNMKPFPEMLRDAFGSAEADSIVSRFDSATESSTSEIVQFRPDLSYLPAK